MKLPTIGAVTLDRAGGRYQTIGHAQLPALN